jgi:hypothetical protein
MTWDKDKPQGSTKIRYGDDAIRENNAALESAFSEGHDFATGGGQTGKHTTPTFKDNGGDPSQPTGTNEARLYNNAGLLYALRADGQKFGVGSIPPGTKMLFKQSSAPAGWTFKAEDNDRVLINTSTEADGGTTGGSWQLPTTDGHKLSLSEIPNVTGSFDIWHNENNNPIITGETGPFSSDFISSDRNTLPVNDSDLAYQKVNFDLGGGGGAHSHTQGNSWRPSFTKVITCSKD